MPLESRPIIAIVFVHPCKGCRSVKNYLVSSFPNQSRIGNDRTKPALAFLHTIFRRHTSYLRINRHTASLIFGQKILWSKAPIILSFLGWPSMWLLCKFCIIAVRNSSKSGIQILSSPPRKTLSAAKVYSSMSAVSLYDKSREKLLSPNHIASLACHQSESDSTACLHRFWIS